MGTRDQLMAYEDLLNAAQAGHINRREVLKRAGALGLGMSAIGTLLAACGGGDDDDDSGSDAEDTGASESDAEESGATEASESTEGDDISTEEDSETAEGGGTFTYVDGTEPPGLDPPSNTGPFFHVTRAIFQPLLSWDNESLEPGPRLATDWEVADDNLTWTFNLKQGVKFHDGSEFTSEAVKYTYERVQDPDLPVSRRSLFDVIEEVIAEEPYVVTIKTAEVFPDLSFFLCNVITSIVSPTEAEKWGPEEFALHPSGTGPFKLGDWVRNDHITLERFEDYHDGPAAIEQTIFRPIPEASAREATLRASEVNLIFSPPNESVEDLQNTEGLEATINDSLTQTSWEMRVTVPPFDDVKVRHAMNYAVDTQTIIDTVMNGLGNITTTPAPPGVWGAIELEPYGYDPERAKQLMAEAGYEDGFDGVFFIVPGRWSGDMLVAEACQSFWAEIGARMEITRIEMGALGEWLSRDPDEMGGAIAGLVRTSEYIDYHLFRLFHPTATTEVASQRSGYVNPKVGELIDQARSTFDEATRLELYAEVQRIVWEDAPFVWTFTQQSPLLYQEGVSDFTVLPNDILLYKDVRVPS